MNCRKILVVEDEFSINDALTFALRKEGYDVRSVFNGRDALKKFQEFQPDLIILDLMLPDMDGFEICKEVAKSTFIIMLTARGEIIDKILGLELGADDYLTKPFEMKEVLVRIKAIFRRNNKTYIEEKDESVKEISFGIRINNKDRTVYKNDKLILLRKKEFDLLYFLIANRGRIFTREELLDKVWGFDFDGELRTVDVHIRRLREKLNEDKENSVIETVFGVGYVVR